MLCLSPSTSSLQVRHQGLARGLLLVLIQYAIAEHHIIPSTQKKDVVNEDILMMDGKRKDRITQNLSGFMNIIIGVFSRSAQCSGS